MLFLHVYVFFNVKLMSGHKKCAKSNSKGESCSFHIITLAFIPISHAYFNVMFYFI